MPDFVVPQSSSLTVGCQHLKVPKCQNRYGRGLNHQFDHQDVSQHIYTAHIRVCIRLDVPRLSHHPYSSRRCHHPRHRPGLGWCPNSPASPSRLSGLHAKQSDHSLPKMTNIPHLFPELFILGPVPLIDSRAIGLWAARRDASRPDTRRTEPRLRISLLRWTCLDID